MRRFQDYILFQTCDTEAEARRVVECLNSFNNPTLAYSYDEKLGKEVVKVFILQ